MSAIKLKENLWSVGVLNPALRVFDIVMESKYGTSYNAYLLTGEKNVLIEAVHTDYFEEYLDNIRQVIPVEDIDYLIMNHNEHDHSGSVAKLLEAYPGVRQRVLLTDETPEMHGFYESLGFVTSQQVGLTAFYYIN